jgi:release factor glutamine methyltransferase
LKHTALNRQQSSPTRPNEDLDTCIQAQRRISRLLAAAASDAEIQNPRLEADLLLGAVTGLGRSQLISRGDTPLSATQQADLAALLSRRIAGEPIAYLLGQREFWGLALRVSGATLIPRPETEVLVEQALARLPADAALVVADLGTGSGAIAAALARERPSWTLIGVDIAAAALTIAAHNARNLALDALYLIHGRWSFALAADSLDAIVSNPPYIAEQDPHLQRGDLRFEPRSALAAGPSGLEAIDQILPDAMRCLRPGGLILIEHGWDQAEQVRARMQSAGLRQTETACDLAGHARVTSARRPG